MPAAGGRRNRRPIRCRLGCDLDGVTFRHHRFNGVEPYFWGHHLVQQFVRPSHRCELGFELGDAAPGSEQLRFVGACRARPPAGVNQVLDPPVVDRLLGHRQTGSDIDDGLAGLDQVDHATAIFGRVRGIKAPSRPTTSRPTQRGRLHRTQLTSPLEQ